MPLYMCKRKKAFKLCLSFGLLDLGRMDDSLIICEPGFAQSVLSSSVRQREHLHVLGVDQWVNSKGKGRKGRARHPQDGTEPWQARGGNEKCHSQQPAAGLEPRNSFSGIIRGRSRWTILENKTMQPTLRVCVLPQRGDASRRERKGSNLIYEGSWNKFRAPDPAPSSEQAIFLEGPL